MIAVPLFSWSAIWMYDLYDDWRYFAPLRAEQKELRASIEAWEQEGKDLIKLYKKDTHGGDTPEETLLLFITALEMEDYELASKYYLVEQQEEQLRIFTKMKRPEFYINILKTYERQLIPFDNGIVYEIEFFNNGEQKHLERFSINKYTGVWKLEDL